MATDTASSIHITTAIPYVNAKPHLGHVLEWFQADALARYYRLRGFDVSFAAGADENSLKNVQAAEKAGVTPQDWLDQYSEIFAAAYKQLGISLTAFRRGSDQTLHWPGVQKLWELCSHDMYKKSYQGWYCVGCEAFYTQDELVDGTCPEHFTKPELIEEENYFFRLSKYQDQIAELIKSDKLAIYSDQYKQEMLGFVTHGLEDFSVSRSVTRGRGVGVPVPNDDSQVMYVWFDALSIYMTSIGWGYDEKNWQKYWESAKSITHVIGKGINRFHSVYWIGMLLSAGLRVPDTIAVHGYITANGQKMSKSLGNVIDPFEVVEQYGLEPIRYYLLKYIPTHADGDFSHDKFKEVYTADLANGLGNLCSRIAKLAEKTGVSFDSDLDQSVFDPDFNNLLESTELDKALNWVQQKVSFLDEYLSTSQPWKLQGEEQKHVLQVAVSKVVEIAHHLQPFMPDTAKTILEHFTAETIKALQPLFPRLEA